MTSRLARRLIRERYPTAEIAAPPPPTLEEMVERYRNPWNRAKEPKESRRKDSVEVVHIQLPAAAIGLPLSLSRRTLIIDHRRKAIIGESG